MSEDQLQPEDTLDDRGVDDILDEGISPAEKPHLSRSVGTTDYEVARGETFDERLAQEEPDEQPDLGEGEEDPPGAEDVGDQRAGRLVAPDQGSGEDSENQELAEDVGIDGAGASAEEAAMHIIEPPD
ncbi:MAG: DUF5709 domain-containing protein [Nocardioides sp.]